MSILNDCQKTDYTNFSGPDQITDEDDLREPRGISCRNSEFFESGVKTRRGFKRFCNPARIITTLYNWVQSQYNRLIYFSLSDTTVYGRDLKLATEANIITVAGAVGMTCMQAGIRIIMAFFNDSGFGASEAKIWDGTITGITANVENVFPHAISTATLSGGDNWGTVTEPAAGSVTAGKHYLALVGTTWNGAKTPPGPLDSITLQFTPISYTASGGKNGQVTITPSGTWPNDLNQIQLAITPVINPNRWFLIPGAIATVARGTSFSITISFSIDDVTLLSGDVTEITNTLFNLYSQSLSGSGPTSPHCVVAYNNRAVYITRILGPDLLSVVATLLISDQNNPQYIIPNLNTQNLPEFRDIMTGATLGTSLVLFGPSWTYSFTDNGDTPVNWPQARQISGTVGSPYIRGVTANPAKGRIWVGDRSGLYLLTGANYPEVPVSYFQQADWDRINFAASQKSFRIVEYSDYRLVVVRAALDGATVANYLMAWDYTYGFTPDKIRYCGLWNLAAFPGLGDIEIVQNPTTNVKELWVSRGDANGDVKRIKSIEGGDATTANPQALYDDDGVGIDWRYRALVVPGMQEGTRQMVAASVRQRGKGQINLTAYGADQKVSYRMDSILSSENSMTPGQRFLKGIDMQSEDLSIEVDNGQAVGAFSYLAAIRIYWKWWMRQK